MELKGKSKVTGLKAKRSFTTPSGSPEKVIKGTKVKGTGLANLTASGKKKMLKARTK